MYKGEQKQTAQRPDFAEHDKKSGFGKTRRIEDAALLPSRGHCAGDDQAVARAARRGRADHADRVGAACVHVARRAEQSELSARADRARAHASARMGQSPRQRRTDSDVSAGAERQPAATEAQMDGRSCARGIEGVEGAQRVSVSQNRCRHTAARGERHEHVGNTQMMCVDCERYSLKDRPEHARKGFGTCALRSRFVIYDALRDHDCAHYGSTEYRV